MTTLITQAFREQEGEEEEGESWRGGKEVRVRLKTSLRNAQGMMDTMV